MVLTAEGLTSQIAAMQTQLDSGLCETPFELMEQIYSRVGVLYDNFYNVVVEVAGNEQKPYTVIEIGFPTRPMKTKKESGYAQVGDYHFYIFGKDMVETKLPMALERKSVRDFHSTLMKRSNHVRFLKELWRFEADPSLFFLFVVVEASREMFLWYMPPTPLRIQNSVPQMRTQLIKAKRAAVASIQARGVYVDFYGDRKEATDSIKGLVRQVAIKNYKCWLKFPANQ